MDASCEIISINIKKLFYWIFFLGIALIGSALAYDSKINDFSKNGENIKKDEIMERDIKIIIAQQSIIHDKLKKFEKDHHSRGN